MQKPNLSVVVPVFNEAESILELQHEIHHALSPAGISYELIFVDDGSTDQTRARLGEARQKNSHVRWVRLRSHFGKSAALSAGFQASLADLIVTMDGDLQDNPADIPNFTQKLNEGFDVVSGWKTGRKDSFFRIMLSKIYNITTSLVSGIRLHDFNCGFKAYRRSVIDEIHIYGEFHRYIPLLAAWRGFQIAELRVAHRPRKYGKSKYGPERILSGFLDLFTVIFLMRFTKKPAHFFGTIGLLLATAGMVINSYILYLRATFGNIQSRYPLLFLGVLLTIVGIQFFSTGLLAEMVTYGQKKTEQEYSIRETST